MNATSSITTTATLTTSGSLTAAHLRAFLQEIPDAATIQITEDRDRGTSSTTMTATWEPQPKKLPGYNATHRPRESRGEDMMSRLEEMGQ